MSPEVFKFGFFLGPLSPAIAIICAWAFYARYCRARPNLERRIPVAAYIKILLVCAVFAYWLASMLGIDLACVRYPSGNLCGLFGVFVTGPLGASLAVASIGGLILLLPGDVEPVHVSLAARAAPGTRAPTPWRFSSVYLKLWHGEYSLAWSFWGFFILGTCIVMIVSLPLALMVFRPVRPVIISGYDIIAGVGVWRSANALIAMRAGRLSLIDSAKAIGAKIVVVLWLLWSMGILLWLVRILAYGTRDHDAVIGSALQWPLCVVSRGRFASPRVWAIGRGPVWVISGHREPLGPCPLRPQ